MSDIALTTISNEAVVSQGETQRISFRPGQPGGISVFSVPSPPNPHSETRFITGIRLRRADSRIMASARFRSPSPTMGLSYQATAADLTIGGDWVCEVSNDSLDVIDFATKVTFPVARPLLTASMDLGLINTMLAKVFNAADLQIHLQTSGDTAMLSKVVLSDDIASLFHLPPLRLFAISDLTADIGGSKFGIRIVSLDSDPNFPTVAVMPGPLRLGLFLRFDASKAQIIGLNLPDLIDAESLSVEIRAGFDGTIRATVNAKVHVRLNNLDISHELESYLQDKLNQKLAGLDDFLIAHAGKRARELIEDLFRHLLRLGSNSEIQGFRVDGQTLFADYFLR